MKLLPHYGWAECTCGAEWALNTAHPGTHGNDYLYGGGGDPPPCRLCKHWAWRRIMEYTGMGHASSWMYWRERRRRGW